MSLIADIVLCLVMAVVGYAAVCCRLGKVKIKEIKPKVFALSRNRILYLVFVAASSALLIVMFQVLYKQEWIQQLILLSLVMMLLPIGAVDYKTKTIPNSFLLAGIIVRVLLFAGEMLLSFDNAIETGKSALIASVGVIIIFGLFLLIFKNSIGAGDIKLFAVMGLYQGIWGLYNSLFFSLLISFLVSITLLITKKKDKKDVIPFGPCAAIGTVIAMALAGI